MSNAQDIRGLLARLDELHEKALRLPYRACINGSEDIDEELTTIKSGAYEVAGDVPNDTAAFLIELANSYPALRSALGECAPPTLDDCRDAFYAACDDPAMPTKGDRERGIAAVRELMLKEKR